MSFCCLPDTNKPHQLAQFTLLCYILVKHIDCIISGVLFIVVIYTHLQQHKQYPALFSVAFTDRNNTHLSTQGPLSQKSPLRAALHCLRMALFCVWICFSMLLYLRFSWRPRRLNASTNCSWGFMRDMNVFINSAFNLREILHTAVQRLLKISFNSFERSLFWSPRLHLFDLIKKYSKSCNIVKYYYNLK